jgi:hypothetical protein
VAQRPQCANNERVATFVSQELRHRVG